MLAHMQRPVIVTCAVTGGTMPVRHRPKSPREIAEAAIEAAKAGAAIVHIHARDPETGAPAYPPAGDDHYREIVTTIRGSGVDVLINLTTGMGADISFDDADPTRAAEGSDVRPALERMTHVEQLRPDLCTFHPSYWTTGESSVYVQTMDMARKQLRRMRELGVKPEMEIFNLGMLQAAGSFVDEGLIDDPPWYQLCLGSPLSAPADPRVMMAMRDLLPDGAEWSALGISRRQMETVTLAMLLGGHARVGLEDNVWLSKGVPATNADLVDRIVGVIRALGSRPATCDEARTILKLADRVPR